MSDALEIFDAVEFDLKFEGGTGTFLTSQSLSPFEAASSALASQVLNEAAVRRYVDIKDIGILPCWARSS